MLVPVLDLANNDSRAWAAAVVRNFASVTNLLIAGRSFSIAGTGQRATALGELLATIGARRVEPGRPSDYRFVVGDNPDGADHPDGATIIIETDGARQLAVPERDATAREFRPGVVETAAGHYRVRLSARQHSLEDLPATNRIDWARRFMPVSAAIAGELASTGLVSGIQIGVSMVLEPKTAVLALLLRDAGAIVSVFAHPDETDDAVAEVLNAGGVSVFAKESADPSEHLALALAFLDEEPQLLIDDGSHLIRLAHTDRPQLVEHLIGAAEETTSGLTPLRLMAETGELRVPVIAVNDARSKTSFDNRYGTGQSCLFTILELLDWDAAGQTIVVAGFGPVGEGVAHHARALGASVIVAEIDPVREFQARFAGYATKPLERAVASADIVISATGVRDTISETVLAACAEGAAIAVAGGVDQEIAIDAVVAAGATRQTISRKVERLTMAVGTNVLLLDNGGCINVTAGEGNPIEIMDLSFAVQLSAIRYLLSVSLPAGLHPLPRQLDDRVAALALGENFVPIAPIGPSTEWRTTRFEAHG